MVRMLSLPRREDLRAKRQQLGLTQSALGDMAGISQSMVARIESGEVDPTFSTLRSIVEALNQLERRVVKVGEVMTRDVTNVGPSASVREAVEGMREQGFSQVPVLQDGVPVGSLTEERLVEALNEEGRGDLGNEPVSSVMAAPFPAVDPEEPVEVAVRMLEDRAAVLVMEAGRVTGVVTKSDLLGTLEET